MRGHLTNEQKQLAFRLNAHGMSLVEIGRQVGCSAPMVGLMVRGQFRQGITDDWAPRRGRLTIQDREQILLGIGRTMSLSAIARSLDRPTSSPSSPGTATGFWSPGFAQPLQTEALPARQWS